MAERRSLVEGLAPPEERAKEAAFVFGAPKATAAAQAGVPQGPVVRVPLHTRIRPDIASALKRVSLERQLAGAGAGASAIQDIVDEALEAWLKDNGALG